MLSKIISLKSIAITAMVSHVAISSGSLRRRLPGRKYAFNPKPRTKALKWKENLDKMRLRCSGITAKDSSQVQPSVPTEKPNSAQRFVRFAETVKEVILPRKQPFEYDPDAECPYPNESDIYRLQSSFPSSEKSESGSEHFDIEEDDEVAPILKPLLSVKAPLPSLEILKQTRRTFSIGDSFEANEGSCENSTAVRGCNRDIIEEKDSSYEDSHTPDEYTSMDLDKFREQSANSSQDSMSTTCISTAPTTIADNWNREDLVLPLRENSATQDQIQNAPPRAECQPDNESDEHRSHSPDLETQGESEIEGEGSPVAENNNGDIAKATCGEKKNNDCSAKINVNKAMKVPVLMQLCWLGSLATVLVSSANSGGPIGHVEVVVGASFGALALPFLFMFLCYWVANVGCIREISKTANIVIGCGSVFASIAVLTVFSIKANVIVPDIDASSSGLLVLPWVTFILSALGLLCYIGLVPKPCGKNNVKP